MNLPLTSNHHTRIIRFNTHQIWSRPSHWVEHNLEKKPPYHVGKVEGLGDSTKPPELHAPPYRWNGWGTTEWVAWCSSLLKAVEGAATQCTPGLGHRPSPGGKYACQGYTLKGSGTANHNIWAFIGEHGRNMGKQKEIPLLAPTYNIMNQWEAKHWKRKLTWGGHMAYMAYAWEGISNWGWCCCDIVVRPTEPFIVSLVINYGSRATSCWPNAAKSTEVEASVTVIVMVDALEHRTVTGGVVVVAVTGHIMRNTLQRKIIHYINFLWLKNTSRRVIVHTAGTQQIYGHLTQRGTARHMDAQQT